MNTITFLKQTSLFTGLGDGAVAQIAQDVVERRFSQGEVIFREGDPGQVLYMVRSGQVRIFVNGIHGSETSVILCGRPGEVFGELAVIDGLPRSATAVALVETVLLTIGRENFRQHMRQSPQLALNFLNELSVRVRYNTRQMNSLTSMDVPQRLARKLMELAQSYGKAEDKGVRITMPLTQSDLASLIGATRESINKSLKDFRLREWIQMHQGEIVILDPEALRSQVTA